MAEGDATTTIEIVAEPPALMLFARWMKLSINIDGQLARLGWGSHSFVLEPGEHTVKVGVGQAFNSKATITVSTAADEVLRLRYVPRVFKNLRGKLTVERLPVARVRRA